MTSAREKSQRECVEEYRVHWSKECCEPQDMWTSVTFYSNVVFLHPSNSARLSNLDTLSLIGTQFAKQDSCWLIRTQNT